MPHEYKDLILYFVIYLAIWHFIFIKIDSFAGLSKWVGVIGIFSPFGLCMMVFPLNALFQQLIRVWMDRNVK
jgi:hypothetical protein